jgi:hypothetical protein
MRRLLLLACLFASACTTALPVPPPTTTSEPTPTARVSLRSVALGNGLTLDVPVGWDLKGSGFLNKATQRLLLVGNGDLESLATIPGNGDIDPAALPSGRVTLEAEMFCSMSCQGPSDETTLPLDWSAAVPPRGPSLPADRHQLTLGVRWFDRSFLLVARWADDAPASDVAAIADIVRSVRADPPPPSTGEYNGWAGVGPLAELPVGSVRFVPLPAGAIHQPRVQDDSPIFVVRGARGLYAFSSRPLYDERCMIRFDAASDHFTCEVDGRTYAWTRFGALLGPPPQNSLSQHPVLVRDGIVWVNYSRDYLTGPIDETAER